MRRSLTPVIIRDGVHEHPAVRAWRSLHPDATPPDLIKMLKRPKRGRGEGRGGVYLLHGLGPNGSHLVAKDCLAEDAAGERASYEEVLPGLSVPCLRYHGWHPHRDGCGGWLFAQEASGAKFDKRDRGHRSLAAKWLGVLHAETLGRQAETNLPTRTSSVYRDWVEETASVLARSRSNPALSQADGELVAGIETLFEQILTRWEILGKQYESMPKAFVHGDFVAKNMVVVTESPPPHVLVFDWGEAHWGPTAIDLFDTDLGDYGAALRQLDVEISRPALERSQSLGLLLRLIMAVRWDSARLETAYAEKAISHMESYSHALGALLGRADWLGR